MIINHWMPTDEGSFESGYLKWKGLQFPDPNKRLEMKVTVGLNGKLEQMNPRGGKSVADSAAEQQGLVVEKINNSIFQISVPYKTEGAQRKVRPWWARQVKVGCSG